MRTILIFFLFILFALTANAQGELFSAIEMETVEINDSVFIHTGVITNTTGVALSSGRIIITDAFGIIEDVSVTVGGDIDYEINYVYSYFIDNVSLQVGEHFTIKITTKNEVRAPRGRDLTFRFFAYDSEKRIYKAKGQLKESDVQIRFWQESWKLDEGKTLVISQWSTTSEKSIEKYFLKTERETACGIFPYSEKEITSGEEAYRVEDEGKFPSGRYNSTLSYQTNDGDTVVWERIVFWIFSQKKERCKEKKEDVIFRSNSTLSVETDNLLAVQIFDTMGRLISSQKVSENTMIQLSERISGHLIIVRVTDEIGHSTTKQY